ncbi:hypothetical protein BJ741DRAFT_588714 [Chytriomyces cf. hyalinus JEL632]|nr:hypothetical protein BJ741DRAFT_588714 [Chytriomyces cf. hyalinus JEL632]
MAPSLRASKFNIAFGGYVAGLGVLGMTNPRLLHTVTDSMTSAIGLASIGAVVGSESEFCTMTYAVATALGAYYVIVGRLEMRSTRGDQLFARASVPARVGFTAMLMWLILSGKVSTGFGLFVLQDTASAVVTWMLLQGDDAANKEKKQ